MQNVIYLALHTQYSGGGMDQSSSTTKQVKFKEIPDLIDTPIFPRKRTPVSPRRQIKGHNCLFRQVVSPSIPEKRDLNLRVKTPAEKASVSWMISATDTSVEGKKSPSPTPTLGPASPDVPKGKGSKVSVASVHSTTSDSTRKESEENYYIMESVSSESEITVDSPEMKGKHVVLTEQGTESSKSDAEQSDKQESRVSLCQDATEKGRAKSAKKSEESKESFKRVHSAKEESVVKESPEINRGSKEHLHEAEGPRRSQESNLFIQTEAYPEKWMYRKLEYEQSKLKSIMKKPRPPLAEKFKKVNRKVNVFRKKSYSSKVGTTKLFSGAAASDLGRKRSQSAGLPTAKISDKVESEDQVKEKPEEVKEDEQEEEEEKEPEALSIEAKIEKYNQEMKRMRTLTFGIDVDCKAAKVASVVDSLDSQAAGETKEEKIEESVEETDSVLSKKISDIIENVESIVRETLSELIVDVEKQSEAVCFKSDDGTKDYETAKEQKSEEVKEDVTEDISEMLVQDLQLAKTMASRDKDTIEKTVTEHESKVPELSTDIAGEILSELLECVERIAIAKYNKEVDDRIQTLDHSEHSQKLKAETLMKPESVIERKDTYVVTSFTEADHDRVESADEVIHDTSISIESMKNESEKGELHPAQKILFKDDIESIKAALRESERLEAEMERQTNEALVQTLQMAADKFRKVIYKSESDDSVGKEDKEEDSERKSYVMEQIREFRKQALAKKGVVVSDSEDSDLGRLVKTVVQNLKSYCEE